VSTPISQQQVATLTPGRGVRELSIPCDSAGYTGVSGIHYNVVLAQSAILMGMPNAAVFANSKGAEYLSAIHGGLGSDAINPSAAPAAGFNGNFPAFPNPEVTGYFLPPNPLSADPKKNGFINTEKIQRAASDAQSGSGVNATVWTGIQGRTKLNFQLWISDNNPANLLKLELYRDLNLNDKAAGLFGAGAGATDLFNAQLVGSWITSSTARNQKQPNFATSKPFDLPSGCNLYMMFRNITGGGGNLAVGSIWLS
jgi:hypothetical protein